MAKQQVKSIRTDEPKSAVKKKQSKPEKTGLSKSDPNYYAKIGAISAAKRKMSPEQFAEMAKKSHPRAGGYHGGRPKKDAAGRA